MLCEFVEAFSEPLQLERITVEDLRAALLYSQPTLILAELHVAFLRPLLAEASSSTPLSASNQAPSDCSPDSPLERGALIGSPVVAHELLDDTTWPELLRWLLLQRCCAQGQSPVEEDLLEALGMLRRLEHWLLPLAPKLTLLTCLMDAVAASTLLREQLQRNLEARHELNQQQKRGNGDEPEPSTEPKPEGKKSRKSSKGDSKGEAEGEAKVEGDSKADGKCKGKGQGKGEGETSISLPPEAEYDYCDNNEPEDGAEVARTGGRAMQRQRAKELSDQRIHRQEIKKKRHKAIAKIDEGTAREDVGLLEDAIRLARAAQMEGVSGGRRWRFPELSAAIALAEQLRAQQHAAEGLRNRRVQLAALPLRCEPLGSDRSKRRYWYFRCEPGRLFIETPAQVRASLSATSHATATPTMKTRRPASRGSGRAAAHVRERPSFEPSEWQYYRSRQEVQQLLGALDGRGVCELALKRALTVEMPFIEDEFANEPFPPAPTSEWLTLGPYVGKRVCLRFDNAGLSEAVVVRYLPPKGEDPALWHVVHDDGDEEDLEAEELEQAIELLAQRAPDQLDDVVGPFADWSNGLTKHQLSTDALGLLGLQAQMAHLLKQVVPGLRMARLPWVLPAHGSAAEQWEKELNSAAEGRECARLLLSLEEVCHALRSASDVDEDGAHAEQLKHGGQMRGGAAVAAAPDGKSCNELAELAESGPVGREHDGGVSHGLAEASKRIDPPDYSGEGSGGEDVDDGDTHNGAAQTDATECEEAAGAGAGLWPSVKARRQWQAFVSDGPSCARLALATSSLRDHAAAAHLLGADAAIDAIQRCSQLWDSWA